MAVFLYHLLFLFQWPSSLAGHCDLLVDERQECGFWGIQQLECLDRGCCWLPFSSEDPRNPPWCALPRIQSCGLKIVSRNGSDHASLLNICEPNVKAKLRITHVSNEILRVEISRDRNEDFIPFPLQLASNSTTTSRLAIQFSNSSIGEFNFRVYRRSDNFTLWNTDLRNSSLHSSIRLTDMYSQIGTRLLKNHHIFGIGYRSGSLRVKTGQRLAVFARDFPTVLNNNLYSSHPFYLSKNPDSSAHGVFFRNAHPMDVVVEAEYLQFKALGGPIDLFFFIGPDEYKVMQQFTQIIGRPAFQDSRILGFHQSRFGYNTITEVETVVGKFQSNQLPLDSIWLDIDYMNNHRDFTIDPIRFPAGRLQELIKKLDKLNMRIIPIVDPGITSDELDPSNIRGRNFNVFLRNGLKYNPKQFYSGISWPGTVNFVDFFHQNASEYWLQEFREFFKKLGKNCTDTIAGIWIDMNEPSNFISGYAYFFPDLPAGPDDYSSNFPRHLINNAQSDAPIYRNTVPMDARSEAGEMIHLHNLYGFAESKVTFDVLSKLNPETRPFILSRSTFPGSGQWTATWLGDNFSSFPQMALSISGILQYGLAGIPFVGADICGFNGEATEELCARWMALGSFYPFARNHNSKSIKAGQEPYCWKTVTTVTKKYFSLRYSLLPYWYTLMWEASQFGWPYLRPLFFEDSSVDLDADEELIGRQFYFGHNFLISPVLEEARNQTIVRLPTGEWYDWETLDFIKITPKAIKILYNAPITVIPIHLRAGTILFLQDPKLTIADTRLENFTLFVALITSNSASGSLYWDDGLNESNNTSCSKIVGNVQMNQLKFRINTSPGSLDLVPKIGAIQIITTGKRLIPIANEREYVYEISSNFVKVTFKHMKRMEGLENFTLGFQNESN